MANISFGVGTSHSPLLLLKPDEWHIRAQADFDNPAGGAVSGEGTLDVANAANVVFDGQLDPGQPLGVFTIDGFDEDPLHHMLGSYCPNLLFPYARETVAAMVQKGGFPEFVLQPINFDALYMQAQAQAAAQGGSGDGAVN